MKSPAGKLTLGLLLGKPKGEVMHEDTDLEEPDDAEGESDGEIPPGLESAVADFRSAKTDAEAAQAFMTMMQCCKD